MIEFAHRTAEGRRWYVEIWILNGSNVGWIQVDHLNRGQIVLPGRRWRSTLVGNIVWFVIVSIARIVTITAPTTGCVWMMMVLIDYAFVVGWAVVSDQLLISITGRPVGRSRRDRLRLKVVCRQFVGQRRTEWTNDRHGTFVQSTSAGGFYFRYFGIVRSFSRCNDSIRTRKTQHWTCVNRIQYDWIASVIEYASVTSHTVTFLLIVSTTFFRSSSFLLFLVWLWFVSIWRAGFQSFDLFGRTGRS